LNLLLKKIRLLIKILLIGLSSEKSDHFLRACDFKLVEEGEEEEERRKKFLEYEKFVIFEKIPITFRVWVINSFINIAEIHNYIREINSLFLLFDLSDIDSYNFLKKSDVKDILEIFEFTESIVMIGINYGFLSEIQIKREQIIGKSQDLDVLYCFEVDLENKEDLDEIFDKLIEDHILKIKHTSPELYKQAIDYGNYLQIEEPERISYEPSLNQPYISNNLNILNLEKAVNGIKEDVKKELIIRDEIFELSEQIREEKIIEKLTVKPKDILTIKKPEGRRKCPVCENANRLLIHETEDKNNIILDYPRIYGRKWRCGLCKTEWIYKEE
jgi:hypothetical protein